MEIKINIIEVITKSMANTAIENEKYFSDLDAVVGDADFGVSLANGFREVLKKWDTFDRTSIGNFLMKVGMVITSSVGGCSGPIWGTGFIKAGIAVKDKETININDIVLMLRAALEGMMARGGAKIGDKTLIDAVVPIANIFDEWSKKDNPDLLQAFNEATKEVIETVELTKGWEAKRGRQSFTGERSKGTYDPGIVAVATMMKNLNKKIQESINN